MCVHDEQAGSRAGRAAPFQAPEPGFETSAPFLFFDYFRIPSRVVPPARWLDLDLDLDLPERHPLRACGTLRWREPGRPPSPTVRWVGQAQMPPRARAGQVRFAGVSACGHVVDDAVVRGWLAGRGRWSRRLPLFDAGGHHVASIWGDDRGNVLLPFDPGEFITNYWSERYQEVGESSTRSRAMSALTRAYYLVRPAIPKALQLALRTQFSRIQRIRPFPAWPIEPALHDLHAWLFSLVAGLAGTPVPWLAPWPDGHSWALVLTHDVETTFGYERMAPVLAAEVDRGYRSSWNFVPHRYRVDDARVRGLTGNGFEVGVHGLRHDGRDLRSARLLAKRLPAIRSYAERWQAPGFRSPSTQRRWDLIPRLGFDYDSSQPDTDPFEPQPGGCCSWLPYLNRTTVELPITLPQDHTLFVILRHSGSGTWIRKTDYLKARGGMALILTHPDYLVNPPVLEAYLHLLDHFRDDATAWRALPREVSTWWRWRDASTVRFTDGDWRISGPAAGRGTVSFAHPPAPAASAIPGGRPYAHTSASRAAAASHPAHPAAQPAACPTTHPTTHPTRDG